MPARKSRGAAASAGVARRHVGVIDIGSNSIRLVVFDSLSRALNPLFNEKILCGIGRGLQRTGRLHEDGARQAVANLRRFAALARAMGVGRLRVMATAAVRDAENGQEFVAEVRRKAGLAVQTLGGDEEARLSALGVVSGIPDADGLMGDLGGGSLELVALDRGALGRHVTLPFGPLRLRELNDRSRAALRDHIDGELERYAWLGRVEGREFYAVGGAWRALARIHMEHVNYPLRVIHHYTLSRGRAEDFADVLARLSRDSLERITRISRRRLEALPYAALVLERVLRRARPARLVFSALGLREGCMYDALPAAVRRRDPLLGACQELAEQNARFPVSGEALRDWVAPVLGRGDREGERLRLAACMLGDIAWSEHPDYRAEIGFLRVLRMPLTGIDHPGRAFMALAVFTRYSGVADSEVTRSAWQLLDEARLSDAFRLGLALRLAFTLSGGTTQVLRRARLRLSGGSLQLILPRVSLTLAAEAVERRLAALASALDKKHVVKAA
jgi:exopolyphosphatase/guanosine-5'-triphosphate,3'-diphosphate pyrophosphatase